RNHATRVSCAACAERSASLSPPTTSHPADTSTATDGERRNSSTKWARAVGVAVQKQEEKKWLTHRAEATAGGKIAWYASLKAKWGRVPWLERQGSQVVEPAGDDDSQATLEPSASTNVAED